MTSDLDIGFLEKPKDLEAFLRKEGYYKSTEPPSSRTCNVFEPEAGWPTLFYYPRPLAVKGEEKPNWKAGGYTVVSELNINFHASDSPAVDEAQRIAEKITRTFNAVLYDPHMNEFYTSSDI